MDATLTNAMVRCLLVIPCFRESERLPKFLPALALVFQQLPLLCVMLHQDVLLQ